LGSLQRRVLSWLTVAAVRFGAVLAFITRVVRRFRHPKPWMVPPGGDPALRALMLRPRPDGAASPPPAPLTAEPLRPPVDDAGVNEHEEATAAAPPG
jgi:hypothetical protein